MPNRKKDIPAVLSNQIRAIAVSLRRSDPSHDKPTWPQVQSKLKVWMDETPFDDTDPVIKWIHRYDLPGKTSISDRIDTRKGMVWPSFDIDNQWELGTSHNHEIPSSANGALATMWRYALTAGEGAGFTVREAQWVDRLRWIKEAGGSDQGVITNEEQMYRNASVYAAHQRVAQGTNKSTRSTTLDAQMLLNTHQREIARMDRLLPPIDGEAMQWIDELAIYKPELAAHYRSHEMVLRGVRPGLEDAVAANQAIQDKIKKADPTGKAEQTFQALYRHCHKIAQEDERWTKMPWHSIEPTLPRPPGWSPSDGKFQLGDPALVEADKLSGAFSHAITKGLWAAYPEAQWRGFSPGNLVSKVLDEFVLKGSQHKTTKKKVS